MSNAHPTRDDLKIVLQPVTPTDEVFLFALFASTRAEELSTTGWPAAQQEAFLRSQFAARRAHYAKAFPEAAHAIVCWGDKAVGTLMVHRTADEIRVVDLALQPEHRGRGFGSRLLRALQEDARATNRPLRLQAFKTDRAVHLYTRLGFVPRGDNGLYLSMEWKA